MQSRRRAVPAIGIPGWSSHVFRLANQSYSLEIDPQGRGFSAARRSSGELIDLTRRPTTQYSPCGKWFYLQESSLAAGSEMWSLHSSPRPAPAAKYTAQRSQDRSLEYSCDYRDLVARARVRVHERDPVERWEITFTNNSDRQRQLRFYSFRDLTLRSAGSAERQQSFNDLHISTGFVPALQALFIANRLLVGSAVQEGGEVYFHAVAPLPSGAQLLGFQDSRGEILGTGSRAHPAAFLRGLPMRQDPGDTYRFDPCASLGVEVSIAPGATLSMTFVEGWASSRNRAAQILHIHLGLPLLSSEQLQQSLAQSRVPRPAGRCDKSEMPPWQFSEDGRRLQVTAATPQAWYHPLANAEGYGAFANNRGFVHSFCGNSQQNAITPFSPALDCSSEPGQAWYVWDVDRDEPLLRLPVSLEDQHDLDDSRTLDSEFCPGSVTYRARRGDFTLEMAVFTLPGQPAEGRILSLKNEGDLPLRLRVTMCIQLVLAELPQDSRGNLDMYWQPDDRAFFAENPQQQFSRGPVFVAPGFLPEATETIYSRFIGASGSVESPSMARYGKADLMNPDTGERAAVISSLLTIAPAQSAQLTLVMGQSPNIEQARKIIGQLRETHALQRALEETRNWWSTFSSGLRVRTGDAAFDRLVNDWLPYQLVAARLWARSGPFQRGGAYGYRDHLQDVMSLAATHPDLCRQQILLHAQQQFLEGDVLQWWHPTWDKKTGIGARNHTSDTLLWLPYVAMHYVRESGDESVWNEVLHFVEGREIPPGAEGVVSVPLRSRERTSLYGHCLLAINRVLSRMGRNGLPLMGSGDWNDALDAVGPQGKGESVWLGFFLYGVLRDFAPLVSARECGDAGDRLLDRSRELKAALDRQWREQRYVRAITDNGEEMAFDDALMSSWPIISGGAEAGRGEAALQHGLAVLEREALVLLLNPPFGAGSRPYPGRITRYPPGVRENGAQYSHGSSWLVDAALQLADTLEGQGDVRAALEWRKRAGGIWRKISPLTHMASGRWADYGLEPHQQAADVYFNHGYGGRGGWSWYTGSAARMLTAARCLLGLEFRDGQLQVKEWARKGDVWPYLQEVRWQGQVVGPAKSDTP
ncbi:MAG: hypothetical protein R3E50_00570 [Halioglobus sp.]